MVEVLDKTTQKLTNKFNFQLNEASPRIELKMAYLQMKCQFANKASKEQSKFETANSKTNENLERHSQPSLRQLTCG